MKKLMGILALAYSALMTVPAGAATSPLPEGNFAGEGLWAAQGAPSERGSYAVTLEIKNNRIKGNYTLPDGSSKTWDFELVAQANGFYQVKTAGAVVGQGYCLEYAVVCHYDIHAKGFDLEETLVSMDGKLFRYGSKFEESKNLRIRWQEKLERK